MAEQLFVHDLVSLGELGGQEIEAAPANDGASRQADKLSKSLVTTDKDPITVFTKNRDGKNFDDFVEGQVMLSAPKNNGDMPAFLSAKNASLHTERAVWNFEKSGLVAVYTWGRLFY